MITTRTRISDLSSPTYQYLVVPEFPLSNWTHLKGMVGTRSEVHDNNNAKMRKTLHNGGVLMSDCSISHVSRSMASGSCSASSTGWHPTYSGDCTGMIYGDPVAYPSVSFSDEDDMNLLMKAFANISKPNVMSGELLATFGETISMLRRPFKSSVELMAKMLKARNRRLKTSVKAARWSLAVAKANANAWLEYRYGWQPIMIDCENVVKAIDAKRQACDLSRLVSRAGSKRSYSGAHSWSGRVGFPVSGSSTLNIDVASNVGVIYDLKDRSTPEYLSAFAGTRVGDIPPLLWELMPYSFVIDWFTNIGSYIQASMPRPGVDIQGWWITRTTQTSSSKSGTVDGVTYPGSAYDGLVGNLGSEEVTTSLFERTCNQELTFTPALTIIKLSQLHQIDALALIANSVLGSIKALRH